jgi:hypothetical protein
MSEIPEEPPDENEAYENLDEALDDVDLQGGYGGGPEGQRDLDSELIVDRAELEEAGANLDDPDRISVLDGGMDDPDGLPPVRQDRGAADAGWDVDPVATDTGYAVEEDEDPDGPELDPELELIVTDATDLEDQPDDAPGPDSARW